MAKAFLLFAALCLLYTFAVADDSKNVCGRNESYNLCGRLCEPTCANQKPNSLTCPRLQCTRFIAACRCNTGYYRRSDGKCVTQEHCPCTSN